MTTLHQKIADISRWWIAMILTSFATGILLVYADSHNQLLAAAFVIGLGGSVWFTLMAAAKHYERHREDSQDNTRIVLALLAISIAAYGTSTLLHAPHAVQALLSGASSTSLFLLYKNYRVADHKHHDGNRQA